MNVVLKKKWGKPITNVQVFVPQEYIAACSFTCGQGMDNQAMFPLFYEAKHSSSSIHVYTVSGSNNLGWWCEGCGRTFDVSKAVPVRSEKKNNRTDQGNLYGYAEGEVHVVYAPNGLNAAS